MKIVKRSSGSIKTEEAHGGAGSRKVYANSDFMKSTHFEAMTRGWLPAGKSFDWHDHTDIEEIMVVVSGVGEVHDDDGQYEYAPGDVFVFPANTMHKIHNPTSEEHEMIFVRVKV
jgi:mannose-6-phosphate isomerase-like protein (cupin superfamily)